MSKIAVRCDCKHYPSPGKNAVKSHFGRYTGGWDIEIASMKELEELFSVYANDNIQVSLELIRSDKGGELHPRGLLLNVGVYRGLCPYCCEKDNTGVVFYNVLTKAEWNARTGYVEAE